jgi:threonine synthase
MTSLADKIHAQGDRRMSYLHELLCSECSRAFPADLVQTFCPDCQAPLLARYDLVAARARLDRHEISHRPRGMWRWMELLPVRDPANIVSLGEGDTPLLEIDRLGGYLGFKLLYVKDESRNPSGSFKARGLAAAVSKARELGVHKLIMPTAGNAGGALAAYAARSRMQADPHAQETPGKYRGMQDRRCRPSAGEWSDQ